MDGDIGVLCLAPPFFLHDLRGLYASFLAYRILGLFSVLSQCLSIVLLGSEGFFSLWLYLFMYLWFSDLYLFILHIRKHISCFNASCFSASCPLIHSCVRIVTVCGKEFCIPLLFLSALPPYRIWPIPRLPKTTAKHTAKSIFLVLSLNLNRIALSQSRNLSLMSNLILTKGSVEKRKRTFITSIFIGIYTETTFPPPGRVHQLITL